MGVLQKCLQKTGPMTAKSLKYGGRWRTRTADLLGVNQALSQLS